MRSNRTFEIKVEPSVMDWAVKSSGWEITDLAKRIKVTEEILNSWMEGNAKPTLRQLEILSNAVKRPLAAFLLPAPPEEEPLPIVCRNMPV
ncbi:MAG: hypothetical protein QME12_05360 [Nanoarchaeota archaeon]|nr:hypothetical protein [Nanoarchaeota archaeon]